MRKRDVVQSRKPLRRPTGVGRRKPADSQRKNVAVRRRARPGTQMAAMMMWSEEGAPPTVANLPDLAWCAVRREGLAVQGGMEPRLVPGARAKGVLVPPGPQAKGDPDPLRVLQEVSPGPGR